MGRCYITALELSALLPKLHDILCFLLRHSASSLFGLLLFFDYFNVAYLNFGYCSLVLGYYDVHQYWRVIFFGCFDGRVVAEALIDVSVEDLLLTVRPCCRSFTGCVLYECARTKRGSLHSRTHFKLYLSHGDL